MESAFQEGRRRWLEVFGRRAAFHATRISVVGFDHWQRDTVREVEAATEADEAASMDRRILAFMRGVETL